MALEVNYDNATDEFIMLTAVPFPVRIAGRWASKIQGQPNFSARRLLHAEPNEWESSRS